MGNSDIVRQARSHVEMEKLDLTSNHWHFEANNIRERRRLVAPRGSRVTVKIERRIARCNNWPAVPLHLTVKRAAVVAPIVSHISMRHCRGATRRRQRYEPNSPVQDRARSRRAAYASPNRLCGPSQRGKAFLAMSIGRDDSQHNPGKSAKRSKCTTGAHTPIALDSACPPSPGRSSVHKRLSLPPPPPTKANAT
jgi:hypothetical protein